ncbi:fibronectin type III domain-containing protein [Candidatus Peregrinibacteria bacterium]|nr:fibronectin type III domain-containing protein [Candidatus Peregrinibacteria bacterium]
MKKLFAFSLIIGVFSILAAHSVQADTLYRVQLDEVISRRSITILHPETHEPYLLHLQTGCGELTDGQNVSVSIRGALNSNGDVLKVDATHQCAIDQAETYTQKYYVKFVFTGNTEAWVIDESGEEYFMEYLPFCQAMPRYLKDHIYILQGTSGLAKGDKIYLPNKDGQCSVDYVRRPPHFTPDEKTPEEPQKKIAADIQVPTAVTNVRASAGNKKVSLTWRAATDNEGIDHYVVSYNNGRLTTKNIPWQNMPNQAETKNTYLTISGLENNETYFFWVLAVDTSGNVSDDWSTVAQSTPKASVLSEDMFSDGDTNLDVRIDNESVRSFFVRWNPVPDVDRYTVILETDGEREFTLNDLAKQYIRVLKRSHREGKTLKLTVRAYSLKSFLKEETIEFSF